MTAYEIVSTIIDIFGLLIAFGSFVVLLLTFLKTGKRKKKYKK